MMVEVMPRVWVNPEQVAGLWGDGTVVKIMLNGQVCAWRNDDDVDLSVIAAKLNLPTKWEQPPADDGTIEIRNMAGEVRRVVRPPGVLARDVSEYAPQAIRGGLQWGATTGDREATDL